MSALAMQQCLMVSFEMFEKNDSAWEPDAKWYIYIHRADIYIYIIHTYIFSKWYRVYIRFIVIIIYIDILCTWVLLNFTRSWGFGIFTVYWVSKSKCIISSNLRAEGSWGKVLNVVIFVESVVHRSNWRSRETETVGNSRKQSETVGNSRERPGVIVPKLSIRHFFAKKKKKKTFRAIPFFWKCNGKQLETVGARTFDSAKKELFKTSL